MSHADAMAPTGAEPRPAPFPLAAFFGWLAVTGLWWALAFAPLSLPPDWLTRTRAICFGTLPSGLPDDYGWMLLVLGPASMLGFLLVVWGRELRAGLAWLSGRLAGATLLGTLALALAVGAIWLGDRVASAARAGRAIGAEAAPEPLPEFYPRGGDPAPPLRLTAAGGASFDLASLRGRPALVTFAFAHCRTVCPVLVATLRRARDLSPPALRPAIVVVTLDPWRDTVGSLSSIAAQWQLADDPDARVLSGEISAVTATHDAWGIGASRDLATGDIVHPGLAFVVDPEGRLAYRFLNPSPAWLVEALRRSAEPAR
ncbi:MAG: SCO family protein [Thermoanaerobaculia bacterium]